MLRPSRALARPAIAIAGLLAILAGGVPSHGAVTREDVERAIRDGLRYLKQEQRADGSWDEVSQPAKTGTTSLVTLAIWTAGEKPDSPSVRKALTHLRRFGPEDLRSTYAIALQTMVFAAAEPERDQLRIAANVSWLESAQIKPPRKPPGCWTYNESPQGGDNSNTQYALLGLNAATEVGVPVKAEVWALARLYWENTQRRDGGWGYHAGDQFSTSSMTCAGVSSLVITGSKRFQGAEYLQGALIHNCGQGATSPSLQNAIDWLGANFSVGQNFPMGQQWKHYFLYGLDGLAGSLRFAFSVSTTGIAWGPRSWSAPRTGYRASGEVSRSNPSWPPASRFCFWPRAARRSWSTSSATGPGETGITIPTTSATLSPSSRATGKTSSPGRSSIPLSPPSPTSSRRPSSSSTDTGSPSSMPWPSRTSATTSSKAGSCSPTPAAPAPNSIPD